MFVEEHLIFSPSHSLNVSREGSFVLVNAYNLTLSSIFIKNIKGTVKAPLKSDVSKMWQTWEVQALANKQQCDNTILKATIALQ